jgi:hypothetical protein
MGVADDPPPQPPHPSDGNDEHGNDGQTGERQDGMDTDRSSAAGNASANSVVVTPGASSSGSVVRRLVSEDEEVKEYVDGVVVYDLLMKNDCVDEDGRFIWRSGSSLAEQAMSEEIQNFLLDDQENLAGNHGVDLGSMEMGAGGLEVALPEDILPNFENTDKEEAVMDIDQQGKTKKKKVWGSVQATRQSSRVDSSMNVMKKSIE